MAKVKIVVSPKIRRKLAAKFNKTENTIYSWLAEREEGTAEGNILKCRELAVKLGGIEWYMKEEKKEEKEEEQSNEQ